MTKNEVLKKVSELTGVTQKEVDTVIKAFADTVIDTLSDNKDEKIGLANLGTFKVKNVKERRGIIQMGDRKGEEYVTPAHQEITFKISKGVKVL